MFGHPLCLVTVSTYFLIGWQQEFAVPVPRQLGHAIQLRYLHLKKWDHLKPEKQPVRNLLWGNKPDNQPSREATNFFNPWNLWSSQEHPPGQQISRSTGFAGHRESQQALHACSCTKASKPARLFGDQQQLSLKQPECKCFGVFSIALKRPWGTHVVVSTWQPRSWASKVQDPKRWDPRRAGSHVCVTEADINIIINSG